MLGGEGDYLSRYLFLENDNLFDVTKYHDLGLLFHHSLGITAFGTDE